MMYGVDCASTGSSPRLRGARPVGALLVLEGGIIPALAGSTADRPRQGAHLRDHPRACGEHRCAGRADRQGLGIIPALAGSTVPLHAAGTMAGDHPRACGEHLMSWATFSPVTGSSPRLRGALLVRELVGDSLGIIPALAGSTLNNLQRSCKHRADTFTLSVSEKHAAPKRQNEKGAYRPPNFFARRYLLALLQPFRIGPTNVASSVPVGRQMSSTPSQSTGCQSG